MAGVKKHVVVAVLVATSGAGLGCRGMGPVLVRAAIDLAIHAAVTRNREKREVEEPSGPWMIRLWLQRNDGKVRSRKVLAIARVLDLSNRGLTQVLGLEKLVWLRRLNLSGNRIYSIDVSRLVRLKHLDLSHNSIRSLNGLERLTELEILRLDANGIKWIAGLKGLCNAKQINLASNPLPPVQRQRVKTACPNTRFLF